MTIRPPRFQLQFPHMLSRRTLTPQLLSAVLEGLEAQKQRVDAQIALVRSMLGDSSARVIAAAPVAGPKRRAMGAAARQRIAAAQKKRWQEFRKARETTTSARESPETKPPRKSRLSAAGRRRIAEAARKRWAAKRAEAETAKNAARQKTVKASTKPAKKSAPVKKAAVQKAAAKKTASAPTQVSVQAPGQ